MTASFGRWLVTGVASNPTDGGLLRAHHVYRELIRRTHADVVEGVGGRALAETMLRRPRCMGSRLATADLLIAPRGWSLLRRLVRPTLLDLHDQPVIHREALGFPAAASERATMQRRYESLIRDFATIVVQTPSFAELAGLPHDVRVVVVPNGADTAHIRAEPWPSESRIAMISGAAPGRGIELLVEATRLARASVPDARLDLGLIATGPVASRGYLDRLRGELVGEDWLTLREVPYRDLSGFLGASTAVVIPHPPHAYWDAIVPIKLFDAMAAGRPVVVTPRTETARVLREHDAGIVAASDRAEDLAAALVTALSDAERSRAMGANARRAAEEHYDWPVLSTRLADAVLGRAEETS